VSDAKVDVVRRLYAAMRDGAGFAASAGDAGGVGEIWSLVDAEVEFVPAAQSPLAGSYRGHDGVREFFRQVFEVWDEQDLRREPEEIEVLGDQVIATVRVHARFKGSGIVLDERWADVWTVRDGKVQRLEVFTDPAQALKAFGVRHQP
jgi:uncharacterized protein